MKGQRRKFLGSLLLGISLLTSCISGLDPIPSDIKDLSMSWSLPIGKSDFKIKDGNVNGLPIDILSLLQIDTIYYSDTVSINLSEIYQKSSAIKSLSFKINVTNEFPANGIVQLCFIDIDGEKLFALGDNKPMEFYRGRIRNAGTVLAPGFTPLSVYFTKEDIEKLKTSKFLIFNAKLILKKTSTNSFKYFDNFKLTCQLGARIDFTIN